MEYNKPFSEADETDITEELNNVMKNIYTSCDLANTNQVNPSKLVTFIQPYMVQDLSALEKLKLLLDPNNDDKPISSEEFYEVMKDWAKQVSDSTDEGDESFNRTPSQLNYIDDKELPYVQSTPRASFGQKLLNGSGLLSLSLNSSFNENNNSDVKYALEEQVKKLNHQLSRIHNEMVLVKLQLTSSEEQNEILQSELADVKKQLQQEHQHSESLQLKMNEREDLQEDLNAAKQQIQSLQTNLTSVQKENQYLNNFITKLEQEKNSFENKYKDICRKKQDAEKLIIDIKTEFDLKVQEISDMMKLNDELKSKNQEQKELLDQYINENELLVHKTNTVEKLLRSQASNLRRNSIGCFGTSEGNKRASLSQTSSQAYYTCLTNNTYNSPKFLHQISHPITPTLGTPTFLQNKALKHIKDESFSTSTPKELKTELNYTNNNLKLEKILSPISDSPPVMYVVERSEESDNVFSQIDLDRELSSEDEKDLFWKLQLEPQSPHESLKMELDRAIENNASVILFEKEERIAVLECKLESLQDENKNLQDKVESLLDAKNKLNQELDKIKSANVEIEHQNLKLNDILSKKENKLKALEGVGLQLEEQVKLKQILQDRIKGLELTLENKSKENINVSNLSNNIEDTMMKIQTYVNERSSFSDEINDSKHKLEMFVNSLQIIVEQKSKEICELKSSLEQDNATKRTLWENIQVLKSELDKEKDCVHNFKLQCEHLTEEKQALQLAYDEIKLKCANLELKLEEELTKTQTLQNDLEETRSNLRLEDCKYKNLKTHHETVNEQLLLENKKSEEFKLEKVKLEEELKQERVKYEKELKLEKLKYGELKSEKEQLKIQQMEELKANESIISTLKNDKENMNSVINDLIQCIRTHLTNIQVDENNNVEQLKQIINILINRYEEQKKVRFNSEQNNDSFDQKRYSYEKQRIIQEKYQEKIEKLETVCNNTNKKLMNLNKERDNLLNKIIMLENQLKDKEKQDSQIIISLQQKILQLTNDLHVTKQNVLTLVLNNEELQSQYHKIEFELNAKNNEIVKLTNEKSELNIINSQIKEQLKEYKHEHLQLLSKNEEFEEFLKNKDKFKTLLDNLQEELKETEIKLLHEREELSSLTDFGIIYNKKEKLIRIIKNWKSSPNIIADEFHHFLNEFSLDSTEAGNFSTSIEWEIYKLQVVLDFAILLTDFLSERFSIKYEMDSILSNKNMYLNLDQNLRPRTESPDSPFEIENNLSESIFHLDFPLKGAKNIKKFTVPKLVPDSPDSPSLEINKHGDTKPIISSCDVESSSESMPPNQEASPNLSESFLESVSLHESSSFKKLDRTELEDIFVKLVMQLTVDWRDTKDRKLKQQERCTKMETQLLNVIKNITYRLRDHKCIGAQDPIIPIFLMLEEVKNLIKELVKSAGQYGAICYELRMMKCWNLATNYTAMLKQSANCVTSSVSPIKPNVTTESPKTGNEMVVRNRKSIGKKVPAEKCNLQITSKIVKKRYCSKLMLAFMLIFLCILCLVLLEIYCDFSDNCEKFSFFKYSFMGPSAY